MLSGVPSTCFFFVFVLSGASPTCFSLFLCCRGSRQRVFLCFHAVGGPANVFFFVFVLSGTPPGCFFPYLYYRASHRWQIYLKLGRKQLFYPLIFNRYWKMLELPGGRRRETVKILDTPVWNLDRGCRLLLDYYSVIQLIMCCGIIFVSYWAE